LLRRKPMKPSASSGEFTDLAFFLLRCSILSKSCTQLDDDELVVIGLTRTYVTPDAEREVVIV